ncbi:uncharacterized protein [Magallana gigas]|uniref:uncharacterized protein n=1 Tax=Magallana gigas TaxID=29159 RepID=UPI00333F9267
MFLYLIAVLNSLLYRFLTTPVGLSCTTTSGMWDYEYMDRRNERPPFRGLPDILRELYHKHSQNLPPNRHIATVKRGDRYSINDLIAYLKGMVGSDEIYHTGRSTYVRWGAGG